MKEGSMKQRAMLLFPAIAVSVALMWPGGPPATATTAAAAATPPPACGHIVGGQMQTINGGWVVRWYFDKSALTDTALDSSGQLTSPCRGWRVNVAVEQW